MRSTLTFVGFVLGEFSWSRLFSWDELLEFGVGLVVWFVLVAVAMVVVF